MEIPYAVKPRPDTGLYNAKLGIWLFLASEVMLFGALFSSYILLRVNAEEGTWPHHWLNIWLGMTNTFVLIFSSVTVVLGWASLKMGQFKRYKFYQGITLLCALVFLGIKSVEYRDKFMHYEVHLKDGRIADGHLQPAETTDKMLVLEGPVCHQPRRVDGRRRCIMAEEPKIEIPKDQISIDGELRPVAQHLHRDLFHLDRLARACTSLAGPSSFSPFGGRWPKFGSRTPSVTPTASKFRACSGILSIWFGSSSFPVLYLL